MVAFWLVGGAALAVVIFAIATRPRWARLDYDRRLWRYAWRQTRRWARDYLQAESVIIAATVIAAMAGTDGSTLERIVAGISAGLLTFVLGAALLLAFHAGRASSALYERQWAILNRAKRRHAERTRQLLASIRDREDRLAAELDRRTNPIVTVRFERSQLLLDIRNDGSGGEFWTALKASGHGLGGDITNGRAKWLHTNDERCRIPKGAMHSLLIAKLDIDLGLFTWHVINVDQPWSWRNSISWTSEPECPRPHFVVEVVIMSDPDARDGAIVKQLAFHGSRVQMALSSSEFRVWECSPYAQTE